MLNHKSLFLLLGTLFTLGFSSHAFSQSTSRHEMLGTVFSEIEKRTIGEYYQGRYGRAEDENDKKVQKGKKGHKHKGKKSKGLPPGLAKRESLPPGLAKQLKRNGRLPPGLAKRELPSSLERMLPATTAGYERALVDNDVVLIEKTSGLIMDILRDVF